MSLCRLCLVLLTLVSLTACSRQPRIVVATLTATTTLSSADRTATAQPAATRVATATPTAQKALRAAIDRTVALSNYHMKLHMTSIGLADDGKASDMLLFSGDFDEKNSSTQSRVPIANEIRDLQVVHVDGRTYVYGPLKLPGAEEQVWYELAPSQSPLFSANLGIDPLLIDLTERIDLGDFTADGQDTLDALRCTRYRAGLQAAWGILDSTGRPTTPEAIEAEKTPVVERMEAEGFKFGEAEALMWVCSDLFLHQIKVRATGQTKQQPGKDFTLTLDFTASKPKDPIVITAPRDARALPPALTATVFNGGNLREEPSRQGRVLDQINAGEQVFLLGRTTDGQWYQIVNERAVRGWVSVSLLTIDEAVVPQVPVVDN